METWRDISVIIAMLVANGLAIITYYKWTKRQELKQTSKDLKREDDDLTEAEEEITTAHNQPRESIIYGITREEYEKRIVQLEDFIAKEDTKSKQGSESSSRKSSLESPVSSVTFEADEFDKDESVDQSSDEPEIIEEEIEPINHSTDEMSSIIEGKILADHLK